jgi:tetratricopeptide (TPR) repeat protein
MAWVLINRFRDTRDEGLVEQAKPLLDKVLQLEPHNARAHSSLSIYYFIVGRDIDSAIACIRKCKNLEDPAWRFSFPFLYAYKGDMRRAEKYYKRAVKHNTRPALVNEVEDFILWVLEEEPDKVQLYYCLGLLNELFKEDHRQAIQDYNQFLNKVNENDFVEQQASAQAKIERLQRGEMEELEEEDEEDED